MAITIEDPEVEQLALRLAAEQGVTVDRVIADALRARALNAPLGASHQPRPSDADARAAIERIQARVAALPVLDRRPADEILYDEFGLPP